MKPYKKPLSLVLAEKRAQLTQPPIPSLSSNVRRVFDHGIADKNKNIRGVK